MSNGIGRVWAVNAEGGDEGRPNGVGPVYIENADQLGSKLPEPAAGDVGKVLGVLNSDGDVGWVVDQSGTLTQVQADWNESDSSQVSYIQNKPNLASVATSGSYADLSNKPTIPTVDQAYDAASANAQSGVAVASAVSGKQDTISDLETIRSGAEAGATAVQPSQLATVATTGSYADLSNKPSIPAAQVNADWDAVSGVSQILNKPTLATVATSGSYADLSNKPSIPAAQVQSDWNQTNDQAIDFIKNKPTIPAGVVVDQSYSASSTNAQSGTAVAGALATVKQVPASTSADEDKVLTVDSNGDPVWATAQGGSSYTAGDGIAISGQNAISAKVGDGLEIGQHSESSTVTTSITQQSVLLSEGATSSSIVRICDLTSDIANYIETSGYTVTTQAVQYNGSKNFYVGMSENRVFYLAILEKGSNPNYDYITRGNCLILSEAITAVNSAVPDDSYEFNISNLNSTLSTINWATVKANPTNYELAFSYQHQYDSNNMWPCKINNLGLDTYDTGSTYTIGSASYAGGTVVVQGCINVSNPVPAAASADNGKVLGVTDTSGTLGWVSQPADELPSVTGNSGKVLAVNSGATGVEWTNFTQIEVVASMPANPTSGVLYIVTGS